MRKRLRSDVVSEAFTEAEEFFLTFWTELKADETKPEDKSKRSSYN